MAQHCAKCFAACREMAHLLLMGAAKSKGQAFSHHPLAAVKVLYRWAHC
jgi:hypothetical protein